jgi:hypothetical protein
MIQSICRSRKFVTFSAGLALLKNFPEIEGSVNHSHVCTKIRGDLGSIRFRLDFTPRYT